jgi:ADP-dependent NAD(P)H-hydrate dehydratase / NAD(P)H-hydrate epimerase
MLVCTREQMRELDRQTIEVVGLAGVVLMEIAGRSAAHILHDYVQRQHGRKAKTVAIFCGGGNNGGDGYVMARHLDSLGYDVDVMLLVDPQSVQGDAWTNLEILRRLRPTLLLLRDVLPDITADSLHELLPNYDIYVDALLGTGLETEVRGNYREVIRHMNERPGIKFAVDVPSGLDANSGWPLGIAFEADLTATFGFGKNGLYLDPGRKYAGEVHVVDIGILPETADEMGIVGELLTAGELREQIATPRPRSAHKGDFGHVGLIAGSRHMPGAASLAVGAALSSGVGLTTLLTRPSVMAGVMSHYPEAMLWPELPEDGPLGERRGDLLSFLDKKTALGIGPGLGREPLIADVLELVLLEASCPVVIDADGLNVLAANLELLDNTLCPIVLTPHPGEMARLTGRRTEEGLRDPVSWAAALSEQTGCYVILKMSTTVLCAPDGRYALNTTGNPGMATGGTGDVLTGLLAGLLATGIGLWEACRLAVFGHGRAGDLAAARVGQRALRAGLLLETIPDALAFLD